LIIVCASGYWATNRYNSRETGFAMRVLDSGNMAVTSTKSTLWSTDTADGLFFVDFVPSCEPVIRLH
jgi:hypothetical protein